MPRYVSIDAPFYTWTMDRLEREAMIAAGQDIPKMLARWIAAGNRVIADFPGVTFGIHLCRGGANRPGRYKEGGYEPVAEQMVHEHTSEGDLLQPSEFLTPGRAVAPSLHLT